MTHIVLLLFTGLMVGISIKKIIRLNELQASQLMLDACKTDEDADEIITYLEEQQKKHNEKPPADPSPEPQQPQQPETPQKEENLKQRILNANGKKHFPIPNPDKPDPTVSPKLNGLLDRLKPRRLNNATDNNQYLKGKSRFILTFADPDYPEGALQ